MAVLRGPLNALTPAIQIDFQLPESCRSQSIVSAKWDLILLGANLLSEQERLRPSLSLVGVGWS